jgi:hypothetical protein
LGTYEGASSKLRDQARALGADYVQVTDVQEPHAEHECVNKEYTLLGVAYRSPGAPKPAPSPAPSASTPNRPPAASPACASGRVLEFSVRSRESSGFGVWVDAMPAAAPSGLKLRYDPQAHEIALLRYPDEKKLAVADNAVDLGSDWHDVRLERTPDKIAVSLDGKLVLLYAAAAPDAGASFGLDADGVELRGLRPGCASSASP